MGTRLQLGQGQEIECAGMCGRQNDRWCNASIKRFFPAQCAQAPAIARLQTGEPEFRAGRDQVIATTQRKIQKFLGDFGAHDVAALVVFVGVAATVSEIPGQGVIRARNQCGPQDVQGVVVHVAFLGQGSNKKWS